jgi:hypothetical protein
MTLPVNLNDKEVQKFEENSDGEVAVRIQVQKPDTLTGAISVIDYEHHEIHAGSSFNVSATDTSLANGETLNIAFKTPAGTKRVHLIDECAILISGYLEIIEGCTWNNQTGTKVPIYNRKREATMRSSILLEDQAQLAFVASDNVMANVVNVAGGTIISTQYAFGARNTIGIVTRNTNEWILKPDTTYCIRLTSSDNNNKAEIVLDWYEHTDSV